MIINYRMLISMIILILCIILYAYASSKGKSLNSIKAKEVGDGQHGTDRWMNQKEKDQLFVKVKIPEEIKDMSNKWQPGRVVDYDPKNRTAYIDTSDTHCAVEAPTEVGKTSGSWMVNVQYNMMCGVNMVLPAIKKEVMDLTMGDAQNLGYRTRVIDFSDPQHSLGFDLFDDIRTLIKRYMNDNDIQAKAEAESLAGKLAEDIVTSRKNADGNNMNPFFIGASQGVLHACILLVSMFADKEQIHFGSVRSIVQDILSLAPQAVVPGQKAEPKIIRIMKGMPPNFGPKKNLGAAFAASNETEDNIYASVLDDLRPMGNTLAEQILNCCAKRENFSYKELIEEKTILYIHCPESMPEFFLFFKMIIKKLCAQLSKEALHYPKEKLPKMVKIIWDESGVSPAIQNMETEMSMDRGKGILFDLYFQDIYQYRDKYGENASKIIENQCGLYIVLGVAPKNEEEAKSLSTVCGTQTIMSGSVSESRDSGKWSVNRSYTKNMIDRPLITPGEILRLEATGRHLVLKRGQYPFLGYFAKYFQKEWGLQPCKDHKSMQPTPFMEPEYIDFSVLQDRLEAFKKKHGYITRKSVMEIQYYPEPARYDVGADDLDSIIQSLHDIIGDDVDAIKLLKEKKYPAFMKYMKKYNDRISAYELQEMLEKIAN